MLAGQAPVYSAPAVPWHSSSLGWECLCLSLLLHVISFQLGNRNLEGFGRFISFLEASPRAARVKGEGFPLAGF